MSPIQPFDQSKRDFIQSLLLIKQLKLQIDSINDQIAKVEKKASSEINKTSREKLLFEKNNLIKEEEFKLDQLRRLENDAGISDKNRYLNRKEINKSNKLIRAFNEMEVKKIQARNKFLFGSLPIKDKKTKKLENAFFEARFIQWDKVRFLDGSILFELAKDSFSKPFPCKLARKSFNFLKKYFVNKRLSPLRVIFSKDQPIEVSNSDELKTVLEILKIENHLYHTSVNNETPEPLNLSKLSLNKNNICKIYKLFSKSLYFDFFIDHHNDNFKVVPIPELILNKSLEIAKIEDSFIFTIQKKNFVFLLWEV